MNRTGILLMFTLVLLVVFGFLAFFYFQGGSAAPQTSLVTDTNTPFGSSAVGPSTVSTVPHTSPAAQSGIPGAGNTNTTIQNFMNAADVASSSEGFYLISFPTIPAGENIEAAASTTPHDYEIYFFPKTNFFTVLLLKEPIQETRKSAALDLENRLGVSPSDLCALKYEVNVPYFVNEFYSAKNLGFPGCPGATVLPGD